jgi:histidine triad (HIT) family protein
VEPGCIFCQIGAGRAPGSFAYEDERVFAIMSLEQPTPYKVLVIPRDHVATVYDLTDEQAAAIFRATVRVARVVREASGGVGLNLVQANEPAAGQDVFHFHLHVVPRFPGDGIVLRWDNAVADRAERDRLAAETRARLR